MAQPRFDSFDEIDQKLRVLKLQREIDKEQIKLHINSAKANFYPTNLLGGVSGIVQKLIISFVVKKLIRKFS
jgi:hypothetical protein